MGGIPKGVTMSADRFLIGLMILTTATPVSAQVISEIRVDQPGRDGQEYVEFRGQPGTDLDGLTYLVVGDGIGGCGTVECVVRLDGLRIPASQHLVLAEPGSLPADHRVDLEFENNDNVTHFLVAGFTGEVGMDLDTDDDGVLDHTPWDRVLDSVALTEGTVPSCSGDEHVYGDRVVGPDGHFAPGHVFRCGDQWLVGGFDFGVDDSPGGENRCSSVARAGRRR